MIRKLNSIHNICSVMLAQILILTLEKCKNQRNCEALKIEVNDVTFKSRYLKQKCVILYTRLHYIC